MPHADHIVGILRLDIAQEHISVDIGHKARIRDLIEIDDGLLVIAVPVIRDAYQEFVDGLVGSIEVGELEEIILGSLSVMHEEIGVCEDLIRQDIFFVLTQRTQRKPFGEREISVLEQGESDKTVPVISRRVLDLCIISQSGIIGFLEILIALPGHFAERRRSGSIIIDP